MAANKLEFQDSPGYGNKVLPEGIHHITEGEFHDFFCLAFPASKTRPHIDGRYADFRRDLTAIIPSHHWVDGSFVENKPDPNDVDVVVWVDGHQLDALPTGTQDRLEKLCQTPPRIGKTFYKTDAYLVATYSPEDKRYEKKYKEAWLFWRKWFGKTREGHPKGMISLNLDMPNNPAPIVPAGWRM